MNFKKIALYLPLIALVAVSYFGYKVYNIVFTKNTSFTEKEIFVYVPTNSDFNSLLTIIAPYIKDIEKFKSLAEQRGLIHNVIPGKFILTNGMNTNDIVTSLRRSVPVKVRFNNQERLEDFVGRISTQLEVDSLALLTTIKDKRFLEEHKMTEAAVISMFMPNTYEFYWDVTPTKFRDKLAKEYYKFWTDEKVAQAKEQGLSPLEAVTLASIVQKETAKVDERPRVAKVYLNRLKIGMPLQADPTVIYAFKQETNNFNQVIKRVYYKHLEVANPYNTYRNIGLPPGPIFMPDVSSIDAVLSPEQHNYIYFCASVTNFGYHDFATTLSEHNINAKKYANWLNKQTAVK